MFGFCLVYERMDGVELIDYAMILINTSVSHMYTGLRKLKILYGLRF